MIMRFLAIPLLATTMLVCAVPVTQIRRAGDCTDMLINFDDASLAPEDADSLGPIPDGFQGFNWPDFRITTCPGTGCKSFPADTTKQFTQPHLAMVEGLVGGLLVSEFDLKTSPKASFELQDTNGSFDLGNFDVFDIIDLQEQVKLGAKEDMRVHLDCTKADSNDRVTLTIPFDRNKDSAGYSVTTDKLEGKFNGLSSCTISTTQVFFPLGTEVEIPTESMGLDNLNVCVR